MGGLQRRRRRHNNNHVATLIAAFILISMVTAAEMRPHSSNSLPAQSPAEPAVARDAGGAPAGMQEMRRRLIGSWPPACRGGCGRCRPCKVVRVTIHPGVSVPLDYYPEAWRCNCDNQLFMP